VIHKLDQQKSWGLAAAIGLILRIIPGELGCPKFGADPFNQTLMVLAIIHS